jgi:hypothetical protein
VAAEAGGLDLVLHVGDVSYANGRLEVWDAFMRQVEPYARSVAYMVAAGNHEQDWEPDREARSRRGSDQGGGKGDEPEDGDRQQRDASGEGEEPYYVGNDSGGECGVGLAARFVMPGGRLAAGEAQGPHDNSSSANDSDSGSASGSTSGAASDAEWWPPWRRPRPNPPFWYDFVAGPVAFVVLSTEHSVEEDSPQRLVSPQHAHRDRAVCRAPPRPPPHPSCPRPRPHPRPQWLDAALRAVDRCASPWLVVGMHRPMYVPYPHKSNRVVAEQLRGSLEGALSGAGVDLVVSGHVHSYHRTCAVLGGRCVGGAGGGVTHVVVGSAGKRLSSIDRYDQPEWLEQAIMRFGYGRLTADAARALRFEFVGSEGERAGTEDAARYMRAAGPAGRCCIRLPGSDRSLPRVAALGCRRRGPGLGGAPAPQGGPHRLLLPAGRRTAEAGPRVRRGRRHCRAVEPAGAARWFENENGGAGTFDTDRRPTQRCSFCVH